MKSKFIDALFIMMLLGLCCNEGLLAQPIWPWSSSKQKEEPFLHFPPPKKEQVPFHMPKAPVRSAPTMPTQPGPSPTALFTYPGIVGLVNGQWAGSDDLYNLSPNIEIDVEVINPEGKSIYSNTSELKNKVAELFNKAGIIPQAQATGESPPLPLFNVLIFISSFPKGYAIFCGARLFESVNLDRIQLTQGITYQAITWEKQGLWTIDESELDTQLPKIVSELASVFTSRFQHFQALKQQIRQQ